MEFIERLIARLFGPVFEVLGDIPPHALRTVFMPF